MVQSEEHVQWPLRQGDNAIITFPLLASLTAGMLAFLAACSDWRSRPAGRAHVLLAGCAALLAVLGGVWSAVEQSAQGVRLEASQAEIKQATLNIAALQASVTAKSDKIAELAESNLNATTGGDSYAYIKFRDDEFREPVIEVMGSGDARLFDVRVSVSEMGVDGQERLLSPPFDAMPVASGIVVGRRLPEMKYTPNDLIVRFSARNGHWVQRLRFRHSADGKWRAGTRMWRAGKMLIEARSPGFPESDFSLLVPPKPPQIGCEEIAVMPGVLRE